MSYILDALRRADAERQRGQSPNLHQVAQMPAWAPVDRLAAGARRRTRVVLFAVALLVLIAGAAAFGWWWGHEPGPEATLASAQPVQPAASVVPVPAAASAALTAPLPPAPRLAVRATRTAPATDPAKPAPGPTPKATAPPQAPAVVRPAAAAPSPPASTPPVIDTAAAPTAPASAALASTSASAAVLAAPALPARAAASAPPPTQLRPVPPQALAEPQRSAVVRLRLTGAVHSPDRRQRFVIVNGQIAREGDTLAPDITLERIDVRSAVLRVGDQRVEMPY
jgi:general secretion pathway protein B